MSQSVTYVGAEPEVSLYLNDGATQIVMHHGGVYDLPDDVVANLLEQGSVVHATSSGAPPKAALVGEWAAYRAAQGHVVDGLTKDQLIELPDAPANQGG